MPGGLAQPHRQRQLYFLFSGLTPITPARKRSIVLRCPMIPGINDGAKEIEAIGRLADSLSAVTEVHVAPYIPYGIDKAHRLGLKVYEAPQPPPEYGPRIVAALARHTAKPVRLP